MPLHKIVPNNPMDIKKPGLYKLTAPVQNCVGLVSVGINPIAYIWHLRAGDVWLTSELRTSTVYNPQLAVPAWTKAELDVMIGSEYPKPDLWKEWELSQAIAQDPNRYPIYFPDKLLTFQNGAQASAEVLYFLISKNMVDVTDANERYKNIFHA